MVNIPAERFREVLLDAYVTGFLLEHGAKSSSRYPLAGYSVDAMRRLLEPSFELWLRGTPRLGDAETRMVAP